jgi:hypothetical protein
VRSGTFAHMDPRIDRGVCTVKDSMLRLGLSGVDQDED